MDAPLGKGLQQAFEHGFRLEALCIDPESGEVTGPGGREKLDPKVMHTLLLMAERAGHVVPREELYERLWPDSVVSDDALTRCFSELRRQLSHAGGDERYRAMFETLPKRGYRLNALVTPASPRPMAPARRSVKAAAIAMAVVAVVALVLLVLAGRRDSDTAATAAPPAATSVAVLPFVDMSEARDQAHLADGIAEEILNRLVKFGELRVISRTSSFAFRDRPAHIPEIAGQLGATHVLEGSVRRSGEQIRVTAQLITATDNSHVWSETFDRTLGDLFMIQDDIAASVATALQIKLAGGTTHARMPASIAAHEHFLQGEFLYNRRGPGDMALAAGHYERAVALDPAYGRAWAALSGATNILADDGGPDEAAHRVRQEAAARKAIELDPRSAAAHFRMAQVSWMKAEVKNARQYERQAIALDPDDLLVLGLMSSHALWEGRIAEAIAIQRRCVTRDPLSIARRKNLALLLAVDRQFDAALSEYRRISEINPEPLADDVLETVRILALLRRDDESRSAVDRLPPGIYRDHGLALLHEVPGLKAESDAALARLVSHRASAATSVNEASEDLMHAIRLAEAYAHRGMLDQAFVVLERKAIALDRDRTSVYGMSWTLRNELRLSPFFRSHHGHPRWIALMNYPA